MAKDAGGHGSEGHGSAGGSYPYRRDPVTGLTSAQPVPAHQTGVEAALNPQRPLDMGKFNSFLSGAQGKVNDYYARNYSASPHMKPPTLEASSGGRYMRIAAVERGADGKVNSRSAHTFVDKTTGDVLKPASWKTPAKGARGNVHDEHNGLGRMTNFGPAYNR